MENVTETEIISTPDETSVADTSVDVAPETLKQVQGDVSNVNSDTATQEPETKGVTAETDTETETRSERKYADKYDNVDDLEKAYSQLFDANINSKSGMMLWKVISKVTGVIEILFCIIAAISVPAAWSWFIGSPAIQ